MRKKYEQFYAVTDEKFNKEEFEKIVSKENQLITKGIEVGHIFYFGDKYSKPMGASVDLPGGKKDFVKMGSYGCLLYTSPSPRDKRQSRMPSSA